MSSASKHNGKRNTRNSGHRGNSHGSPQGQPELAPSHSQAENNVAQRSSKSASHSSNHRSSQTHRGSSRAGSSSAHGQLNTGLQHQASFSYQPILSAGSAPSSASGAGSSSMQELPKSVRNAAPELRTAIRRKQNNESAKRSREKKKLEEAEMFRKMQENDTRIGHLEQQVEKLTAALMSEEEKAATRRHTPSSPSTSAGFYGDPF
eukprot:gb/GEZJ01007744.1/.p1 GENE.gb/GEZJ01007744.1/~~gb/GEZJ01007744.1/.p1  ORF type:complete len:206 (-),score=34.97 gb/GEZJ01007744.1/:112-729(-)